MRFQLVWDGIQVEPGMTMSTRNLKNAPRFNLPGADPESTFSMVMIGAFAFCDLATFRTLASRHCKESEQLLLTASADKCGGVAVANCGLPLPLLPVEGTLEEACEIVIESQSTPSAIFEVKMAQLSIPSCSARRCLRENLVHEK